MKKYTTLKQFQKNTVINEIKSNNDLLLPKQAKDKIPKRSKVKKDLDTEKRNQRENSPQSEFLT